MRAASLIRNDFRLQFQHGFYYAYIFVTLAYIGILRAIGSEGRALMSPLIIFTDPAMLGIVAVCRFKSVNEYMLAAVAFIGLLVPAPWHFGAGILPPYWLTQAFMASLTDRRIYWIYLGASAGVHILYLVLLLKRFSSRVG